jgi:hypothetical protein
MSFRIVLLALGVLLLGAMLALVLASRAFERGQREQARRLAAELPAPAPPEAAALAALPEPVRRYLAYAMPEGIPAARAVLLEHGGTFRLQPAADWLPMTGRERFFLGRPAFLWSARIRMFPGLVVAVHDHYALGEGAVDARLLGVLPVARASGPEVAQSALLRFLGEAVWAPPALLPSPWLRWEALDAHRARAHIADGALQGSAVFTFDDQGAITGFEAQRYRMVGDRNVLTPFYGRTRDYRRFGALRVPTFAEAGWRVDGAEQPFIRLEVVGVTLEP